MARTRTPELSPSARPVAVPEDCDDPFLPKGRGRVELPLHIRWSGPPVTHDPDDRADRARVYQQVLSEGTEDDVRHYIEAAELRELPASPSRQAAGAHELTRGPGLEQSLDPEL
jgi:hypothetical protein